MTVLSSVLAAGPVMAPPMRPSLGLMDIFLDAALPVKVMTLLLLISLVAALVITAMKLSRREPLTGGSAFLSALRAGAPLLGLLNGAYTCMMVFIGVANHDVDVTVRMVAPGIVEAVSVIALGLFVGVVAVICHWAVESRIDREVLRS